ncbi:hypothetical protein S83_046463 [Arachis hypogaea]
MFHSASVQQEHGLVHDFVSHIGRFAFDSRFFTFGSDNCALALSNYLHFNVTKQSVCSAASLSLKLGGRGDSNLNFRRFLMISTQLLGSTLKNCQLDLILPALILGIIVMILLYYSVVRRMLLP